MVEHPFCAYDLDCYHSRVLEQELVPRLEAHLEECSDCTAYLTQLQQQQKELLDAKPALLFAEEVLAKALQEQSEAPEPWYASLFSFTSFRWNLVNAFAICLLLGIAGFASWKFMQPPKDLRWMGGKGVVKAYLKRGSSVQLLTQNRHVQENDALRFSAVFSSRVHLMIFFMDEKGKVSWYVPEQPTQRPLVVKVGRYTSPGSLVFDASRTTERAFVYWQQQAFSPQAIVAQVKQAWLRRKRGQFYETHWLPKIPNLWSIALLKK